nr:MAG TPA: hypothetical protein [Caudoviricetes sp.]
MAECIDREATIKRIKEVYCAGCNSYNGVRCRACGTGDAIDMIEDAPAADVAPIEALERLRDELYEQDLITMEGLRKLNMLIGKYTTVHDERRCWPCG